MLKKTERYSKFINSVLCVSARTNGQWRLFRERGCGVTKVGKILRATSLDELPQFFNLLKGDMSLVGPRSPLTYHPWTWDKYTDEQKRMFDVRPGITGWAQVNGRKDVEWNKRIKLNVWYIDHVSLWLNIKILFKTVFKVFSNADNENKGVTVVSTDAVSEEIAQEGPIVEEVATTETATQETENKVE